MATLCLAVLAVTPSAQGQTVAERRPACLACHGEAGTSTTDGVPSLGGQPPDYLLVQLVLFREKQRVVEAMNAMVEGLSDEDLTALSTSMSKLQPPVSSAPALAAADADRGRELASKYRCNSCHSADYTGHDQIPRLAGQREDYLAASLAAYKSNARAGYEPAMNEVAQEVKAEDIPVLAKYLSTYR